MGSEMCIRDRLVMCRIIQLAPLFLAVFIIYSIKRMKSVQLRHKRKVCMGKASIPIDSSKFRMNAVAMAAIRDSAVNPSAERFLLPSFGFTTKRRTRQGIAEKMAITRYRSNIIFFYT